MKRAQIHLYYGGGKGKSTAAFGQAVRAWGRGWRVLVAQFLKDSRDPSSEVAAAAALGPRFRLLRSDLPASAIADPGILPLAALEDEGGSRVRSHGTGDGRQQAEGKGASRQHGTMSAQGALHSAGARTLLTIVRTPF